MNMIRSWYVTNPLLLMLPRLKVFLVQVKLLAKGAHSPKLIHLFVQIEGYVEAGEEAL